MKYLILFFLLLPMVSAVAVSPATIDFNNNNEVTIINTLNDKVNINLSGIYSEDFVLDVNEIRKINLEDNLDYDYLLIEEGYKNGFINSIKIPVNHGENFNEIYIVIPGILVGGLLTLGVYKIRKRGKKFKYARKLV